MGECRLLADAGAPAHEFIATLLTFKTTALLAGLGYAVLRAGRRTSARSGRWRQPARRLVAGAMRASPLPRPLYRQSRADFQTVEGTSTNTPSIVFFLSVSHAGWCRKAVGVPVWKVDLFLRRLTDGSCTLKPVVGEELLWQLR